MVRDEHKLKARIRAGIDGAATGLAVLSTVLVVAPLVAIFIYLVYKGASSLNLDFFTKIPKPVGEVGGGMANAIVGSAILLALASLVPRPNSARKMSDRQFCWRWEA
jgi:phosphate transport system permease protein